MSSQMFTVQGILYSQYAEIQNMLLTVTGIGLPVIIKADLKQGSQGSISKFAGPVVSAPQRAMPYDKQIAQHQRFPAP